MQVSATVREEVNMARLVILASFVAYFAFCWLSHLATSSVERAPLPDITHLPDDPLFLRNIQVDIVVGHASIDRNTLCSKLHSVLGDKKLHRISVNCTLSDLGDVRFLSIEGLDHHLTAFVRSSSDISIFVLPSDKFHFTIGQYRHAWLFFDINAGSELLERITSNISNNLSRVVPLFTEEESPSVQQLHSQASYLLSFSILIEDPSETNFSWDFKQILSGYIEPFLSKVGDVFRARIDSQIIFYADISDHIQTGETGSSFLTKTQLEDFMGRTKWNVESIHTPSFPALHYFVYIPPHHLSPLLIDMETDTASTSTAFILPRWGGVVIANDLSAADATISNFDHVMAQVLGQVRSLFGFPIPAWAEPSSHITQVPSTVGAADWEINFIKRQRLYYNYISGAEQLRILMKLLDDNRQLPVTVHVAKLVQQSVDSLENCLTSAKSRSYNDAYNYCLVGYNAAYSAFFDETMLPLLYFPDEHVYAVYMPYFVPIAMPILSRIGEIFKLLKSRMKAQ